MPPGSDGVVFLPDLVGRGSPRPDPDAAAAFAGLRLRHGRPELTRAVLEGVAFGAKDVAAALAAVGLEPARLLVTGGGAASELWRGIFAGVLGLPAVHAAGDANLGSAMVLAAALGLAAGIDAAASAMAQQSSTMPVAAAGAYAAAYARYLAARAGTAIA